MEAASVVAFDRMAAELRAFGAPRALVARAERAEADERRHARVTARLARAHGAAPAAPRFRSARPRSLRAFALENAREGCASETFGALLALHQARASAEPRIRRAMARIAADETRHAALAWAVDAWCTPLLSPRDRAAVERARRARLATLASSLDGIPLPVRRAAGLPDPCAAAALARGLASLVTAA